jgi:carbon starvation protein CstA
LSPRRVDAGAVVAALGALLLLVSLFLDWYGDRDEGYSAWTVFEVIDLLLAGIALVAISTFLSRVEIERRMPQAPLLLLGGAALVLTASQLIDAPPAVALSDFDLQTGAWLALAGSALLLAGAFMSVARVSFNVERREPATGTPPPETETVKLTEHDKPV